eukprot:CAMPEP_0181223676 /NCGR_PEP_ID=MMETSP1096-20121128/30679_1 /TAXON_ID=156174 ORGANISM="Chrysochromulina ericina, Strain CCMP281" /NCGR_SAMPLE_ID=MMETSP1096 /ASSEMBLY_ACC=CAM_ASM_000453 /LENGTH=93 /DNA_ID=CAMNT_0023316625 /DNA_START=423 /DNA_END=704 /DNA_ORIENTATION=+
MTSFQDSEGLERLACGVPAVTAHTHAVSSTANDISNEKSRASDTHAETTVLKKLACSILGELAANRSPPSLLLTCIRKLCGRRSPEMKRPSWR